MRYSSRAKIGLIFLFISIALCFGIVLRKSGVLNQNENVSFVEAYNSDNLPDFTSPSITEQKRIRGKSSPVKFEGGLENSLKLQEVPKIWIEYKNTDSQILIAKLPKKVQKIVQKRWLRTLQYCYLNQTVISRESKINIQENYINDAAVYASAINDSEITTASESRKINLDEAFAIVNLTAKFAVERYKELKNINSQINPQTFEEWSF